MRRSVKDKIEMISDIYIYLELSFIIKSSIILIPPLERRDKTLHALES